MLWCFAAIYSKPRASRNGTASPILACTSFDVCEPGTSINVLLLCSETRKVRSVDCARTGFKGKAVCAATEPPHKELADVVERRTSRSALAHSPARDPGPGLSALACGAWIELRPAVPHRQGEHHQARGHRHRGHGGSAALGDRHDGDQRDRLDPGRAPGDRADQRDGRRARPQDQDHPGRRRLRLADLRREVQEAAGQRPRRRRVRLLDQRLAQGGAADLRERERDAVLPDLLRRARAVQERDLHGPGSHAADHLGPGLGRAGEESQDFLPDRLRLHLAAHLQQDRARTSSASASSARWSARSITRSATPTSTR